MIPVSNIRVAMLSLHSCPLGKPGTRDTGGMSVYVQQISRRLGEMGFSVDIFTTHYHPEGQPVMALGDKVRLIHLPLEWPQEAGKLGLFPCIQDVSCAINDFKKNNGFRYDLVHSHYWLSNLAGKYLSQWWNVPHMVMLHTSARAKNRALGAEIEPELREEGERDVLASSTLIVAATEKEKRDLIELYSASPDKIVVIPCGVDMEMFHPLPKKEARSILGMDSAQILLYVGRIEAEKGIELLIEAASLINNGRKIEVRIVGGGKEERDKIDNLRQQSQKLGIGHLTHFQEAVPQSELPLYYSAADLCVLPSRYETFGLVALEALACGTPVIASKVGVMAEVIKTQAGILLEEPSSARLASILAGVLDDRALLKDMSVHAREAVLNLGWDLVVRKITDEYRKLVNISEK